MQLAQEKLFLQRSEPQKKLSNTEKVYPSLSMFISAMLSGYF
jgi:hypothetical protein